MPFTLKYKDINEEREIPSDDYTIKDLLNELEVSAQTIFSYHQQGNVIWAEYSGGNVEKGFLVGTMDDKHCLHFTYQHINKAGELKSGSCDSEPREVDGKLRFYEKWKWTTGGEGTSIIEEI